MEWCFVIGYGLYTLVLAHRAARSYSLDGLNSFANARCTRFFQQINVTNTMVLDPTVCFGDTRIKCSSHRIAALLILVVDFCQCATVVN